MNGNYIPSCYGHNGITVSLSVRNLIDLLSQAASAGGQARLESLRADTHLMVRVEPDSTHYAGRQPGYGSGEHDALRAALATLVGSGLAVEAEPEPVQAETKPVQAETKPVQTTRVDPALDHVLRQIDRDLR